MLTFLFRYMDEFLDDFQKESPFGWLTKGASKYTNYNRLCRSHAAMESLSGIRKTTTNYVYDCEHRISGIDKLDLTLKKISKKKPPGLREAFLYLTFHISQ